MRANIKVTAGAVRIYTGADTSQWVPHNVEPTHAPYMDDLTDPWGIGSASKAGDVNNGSFVVEAIEPGVLRWFRVSHDPSGNVTSSSDSIPVKMAKGEKKAFTTHDSNAYTVRSDYVEQPDMPKPPETPEPPEKPELPGLPGRPEEKS